MNRAVSIEQLEKMKFKIMNFEGEWAASFGTPERTGIWIFYANSSNGKTRFMLKLAKYLTNFGRVCYDTLEEGARFSFQKAVLETGMREVARKIILLNREPLDELKERLRKRKSPDIIIIDSLQYLELKKSEYKALKEEFHNKLFIFVSHADGKKPEGRLAKFVEFDADIKSRIEGFKVFPKSRFGGGEPYIIWNKGAEDYWGEIE